MNTEMNSKISSTATTTPKLNDPKCDEVLHNNKTDLELEKTSVSGRPVQRRTPALEQKSNARAKGIRAIKGNANLHQPRQTSNKIPLVEKQKLTSMKLSGAVGLKFDFKLKQNLKKVATNEPKKCLEKPKTEQGIIFAAPKETTQTNCPSKEIKRNQNFSTQDLPKSSGTNIARDKMMNSEKATGCVGFSLEQKLVQNLKKLGINEECDSLKNSKQAMCRKSDKELKNFQTSDIPKKDKGVKENRCSQNDDFVETVTEEFLRTNDHRALEKKLTQKKSMAHKGLVFIPKKYTNSNMFNLGTVPK